MDNKNLWFALMYNRYRIILIVNKVSYCKYMKFRLFKKKKKCEDEYIGIRIVYVYLFFILVLYKR